MAKRLNLELDESFSSVRWSNFLGDAVGASSLSEFSYCSAKIVNAITHGSIEIEQKTAGTEYHETETTRIIKALGPLERVEISSLFDMMKLSYENLSGAMRACKVLANSEEDVLFWAIDPELRIVRVPDKADCQIEDHPVLMDFKTTSKLPNAPWSGNKIQLSAYMIGLERLGFKQTYGLLEYVERGNVSASVQFKVYLDADLRNHVSRTAREVDKLLNGGKKCNLWR